MKTKGSVNKKLKYIVYVYNIKNKVWEEDNKYKSYYDIANNLDLTYDTVRDISLGRCKKMERFIKIEKINN